MSAKHWAKEGGIRFGLAVLWLMHWLPLPVLGRFGDLIGSLLFLVMGPRREITLTNLRLCLPELSEAERQELDALARACVAAGGAMPANPFQSA